MRTASMRPALMLLVLAACARGVPTPTPSDAPLPAPLPGIEGEDDRYYQRALDLRQRILSRATWSDFADSTCNSGAHRIFSSDSSPEQFTRAQQDVRTLERIIVARGVDNPLDTPAGHELLRLVIAWEAAAERPRWDVPSGHEPRTAIATGLSGRFKNPETGKCEVYVAFDTLTVVLPDSVPGFAPPKLPETVVVPLVGEGGLNSARDAFYARTVGAPSEIFHYVRISAAVLWRDFAMIAVNRPAEARATVQLPQGAGGAAYLFHRVGNEWRLLTISRTWS